MNTVILRLLRRDARTWWYHAKLRREGNVPAARKAERISMRSSLRVLRLVPTEHHHRTRFVAFAPVSATSTMCVSNVHPGEWTAFHLIQGWPCIEPTA